MNSLGTSHSPPVRTTEWRILKAKKRQSVSKRKFLKIIIRNSHTNQDWKHPNHLLSLSYSMPIQHAHTEKAFQMLEISTQVYDEILVVL